MVKDTIQHLNSAAETIRNTDAQDLSNMEVGDEFRQGDLRIVRLKDDFVKVNASRLLPITVVRQLAPGTTQGSRHELGKVRGVKMYALRDATALDGPVIELPEPNSITHPEHGDVVNLPAGCYAFPGQRAFADELRRVVD